MSHRSDEARTSAWARWLSLHAYGLVTSTLFRATTPPQTMRARFERFAAVSRADMLRKFPKLSFESHAIGPLAMESVRAVESPRCAIVHLHGGAFVMGSPQSYRNRAMRLSYRCNAEVFVPDYRLAPEHPYPAALDDALVAWQYVRALRRDVPILLSGDSAGGGLGLSLLVRLRDLGAEMPRGAIFVSPWTDLTGSGASVAGNRRNDLWLSRRHLEAWARYYVGNADPRTAAVSPVFADLSALPPLLLLVGQNEILLDDAVRVGDAAARAGTSARVLVGQGMQHDWPLTLPWLDESRSAWAEMSRFVEQQCSRIERLVAPRKPNPDGRKAAVAAIAGAAEHPLISKEAP
jgi:monoterpene epsilon-lactone hydrolase